MVEVIVLVVDLLDEFLFPPLVIRINLLLRQGIVFDLHLTQRFHILKVVIQLCLSMQLPRPDLLLNSCVSWHTAEHLDNDVVELVLLVNSVEDPKLVKAALWDYDLGFFL